LPPDPLTIRAELGEDSVAYRRVNAQLRLLWEKLKADPVVALKRQLWADLLKLVYGREVESDRLWFQHTFLVIVAKCIAVAVMQLAEGDPNRLLSGDAFAAAGISGAVESDFFDWIVGDLDGEALVRRIMNHVRRFRLAEVETDVLKTLYESLIDRQERHGLGEYYTPGLAGIENGTARRRSTLGTAGARPRLRFGNLPLSCDPQLSQGGRGSGDAARAASGRGVHSHRRHGHPSGCGHHRPRYLPPRAQPSACLSRRPALDSGLSRRRDAVVDL
jgi:hypothetical protein